VIGRNALQARAREWGLSAEIVEKDYVLGWLMWGLGNGPALRDRWVFKGGTCLCSDGGDHGSATARLSEPESPRIHPNRRLSPRVQERDPRRFRRIRRAQESPNCRHVRRWS
jgi:hypothetical protein